MHARYVLGPRILDFKYEDGFYQINYTSNRKPWNHPVISAYAKAHQKYNLFKQYNKLIDNNIKPIAVNIDGIEVPHACDDLFDMGKKNGQWKHEEIKIRGDVSRRGPGLNPKQTPGSTTSPPCLDLDFCEIPDVDFEPVVIERDDQTPMGSVKFDPDLIIDRRLHISGAGGNGKTEYIIKLAKIYPKLMIMAPTGCAVQVLKDRADQCGVKINADTVHRVFGLSCRDNFPRDRYTNFATDECSFLDEGILIKMLDNLNQHQSLTLAGDFCQLSPIDGIPIHNNWTNIKSDAYKTFKIKELKKNWRQTADPDFFNLCNSIRGDCGSTLSKLEALKILEKINTRVVSDLPDNDTMDDIHICGVNTQVDAVNDDYYLGPGCKIMCNSKCSDIAGNVIANGAKGVVKRFISKLTPITIEWANGLISTFSKVGKSEKKKDRFTLAYGQTVHKAQGCTIKRNVIINPSRLFAKNHLYVALTRATNFNSIYLTEKMTFRTFSKTVHVATRHKPSFGISQKSRYNQTSTH